MDDNDALLLLSYFLLYCLCGWLIILLLPKWTVNIIYFSFTYILDVDFYFCYVLHWYHTCTFFHFLLSVFFKVYKTIWLVVQFGCKRRFYANHDNQKMSFPFTENVLFCRKKVLLSFFKKIWYFSPKNSNYHKKNTNPK